MIGSYIKTSVRSIVRNKLFSIINVIGLAISMSVGLLLIAALSDIFKYDQFHEHHDRIYRVVDKYHYLNEQGNDFIATTSLKAGKIIQQTFSQPEAVAILHRDFDGDITYREKTIPLKGFWANESMFEVFSFQMILGNPATALKEPFSIVLTQQAAKKMFGNEEAIGKTVVYRHDKEYTITGIVEDPPFFSHIKFEMLASLSTREIITKETNEMAWDNIWSTWVYVLLPVDASPASMEASLEKLSEVEDRTVKNTHVEFALQPLDKIILTDNMRNEIGPRLGSSGLWIFGGLAFVVILSAGFNYTNLSIARSLNRTKEVGIRKVIGAMRTHVIGQFLMEAVIISLSALVIAFAMFVAVKSTFFDLAPDFGKILKLELSVRVVIYFLVFAVVVGVSAGVFPAIFFARINAMQVLKDSSNARFFKKLTMRKALAVFQYCISIIFISSSIVVYKQYKHFIAFDLGFSTKNILNISLQGNKPEVLKNELRELPEVKDVSQSLMITSLGSYWGTSMKFHGSPGDSSGVNFNSVDDNYLRMHGHSFLAGRNFTPKTSKDEETEVIVNESVLRRFNIGEGVAERALGEVLNVDGKDLKIVGVLRDFHYGKANARNDQKEVIFRHLEGEAMFLNVKIESSDLMATSARIESIWKKVDPSHPYEASFYDTQIEAAFGDLKASMAIAGSLAFLAIVIASLGLLGMVVFTTETRMREICIRKVMGAGEVHLLYLLGKGFFSLLVVAFVIALPLTIFYFEKIAFTNMTNHAPLSIREILYGVLAVIVVAVLMISTQTIKIARTNPAKVLKAE